MATIKFIVTGDMEKLALVESVKKRFPIGRINENGVTVPVIWAKPRKLNGATSFRLSALSAAKAPGTQMAHLAQAMFDEAITGKTGVPADLVIVIDDVELGNLGQESLIAEHFRVSVEKLLNTFSSSTQQRYRAILQQKCSFHLFKPMVESYLFGDGVALGAAGVAPGIVPRLRHPTDVEQFESVDPCWLPVCQSENIRRQTHNSWWRHELHPKAYLTHLTSLQGAEYEETGHGKAALMALDWRKVVKVPADAPIICALFEDIADWFGRPNPVASGCKPDPFFYPINTVNRSKLLLRNM
jgi:hypothetical protein